MEFSLIEIISQLSIVEIIFLTVAGVLAFYFFITKQLHIIIFLLVLSASLVGTTIPVVENIAALLRWLSIILLFMIGLLQSKIRLSLGLILFWGYAGVGLIGLFNAIDINWQIQKCILLLFVAAAIPLAYSIETYWTLKSSLVAISLAASLFAILNFIMLPGQLSEALRYSGFARGAATFVIVLGGLLPFTFWGLWTADNKAIRIICGLGFLCGVIALIFSGQRTGTGAGLISLIPMIFVVQQRKTLGWSMLLIVFLLALSYVFIQQSSVERLQFLLSRYGPEAGLTYRDQIWTMALSEIAKNPFWGHGMGAAETVMSFSFHNAYLEVWYNTGILGLFLFLTSQFYFIYRIFKLNRVSKDPEIKSTLALTLGYMLGFIVISIFESTGAGASNINIILFLFLGVLVSNNRLENRAQFSETGYLKPQYGGV